MNDFRSKLRAFIGKTITLGKRIFELCRRGVVWISPPPRLTVAGIILVFLISILTWTFGGKTWDTVLFFPTRSGSSLRGELRSLPRANTLEGRAIHIAAEYVLGPVGYQDLYSAFGKDIHVESVLFRSGNLYVDLSPDAALVEAPSLRLALEGLRKSLSAGLPRVRRVVLTIGGTEPWSDGIVTPADKEKMKSVEAETTPKKGKKN